MGLVKEIGPVFHGKMFRIFLPPPCNFSVLHAGKRHLLPHGSFDLIPLPLVEG